MESDDRETVRDLLEAALRQLAEPPINREQVSEAAQPSSSQSCAAHPGLERFPLNQGLATSGARKPCFMEPDRVCVNSGACEMRGF